MLTRLVLRLALATAGLIGALTIATAGEPEAAPRAGAELEAPRTPPMAPKAERSVDLVMGTAVENREVRALADKEIFFHGEAAYAWTRVTGLPGQSVTHIWFKDGREVARHALSVNGKRWRTWSRQTLSAGVWKVVVLSPANETLAETTFDVDHEPGC